MKQSIKLIQKLREELYSKQSPGEVLNNIMEERLKIFLEQYKCNEELLWIGAYLADIRISEAIDQGDITQHVAMAFDYAQELYKQYDFSQDEINIVNEIIATHHGGKQKFIESKLFKNADNFKFLEPKGLFHLFGAYYTEKTEDGFTFAARKALDKLEEKMALADLDEETIAEAQSLYEKNKWFFERMGLRH